MRNYVLEHHRAPLRRVMGADLDEEADIREGRSNFGTFIGRLYTITYVLLRTQ